MAVLSVHVGAQITYDPGVTNTQIKIGQTMPYSGPASAYGTIGRAMSGYLDMINDQGGINGRKIKLISLDDGYSPPKTVEQTRKLVEQEEVLLIFGTVGTAVNAAIHRYLNDRRVPQLFIASIGTKWGDPQNFPWTMAFSQSPRTDNSAFAKYLIQTRPTARIGVIYQNDDLGKDYLKTLKEALGSRAASMIVSEMSYEVTDPTVDSQVVSVKGAGADTLFNFSSPKFAAQIIRKVHAIGWKPVHFVGAPGTSVGAVLKPAGLEKSVGIISAAFFKDPTDSQWAKDPGMKYWLEWMKKYHPNGDVVDAYNVYAYTAAQALVEVLKLCGDRLTRENVMKQAANLKNLELPMLLPGIRINTSPTDYYPIKQTQLQHFDGKQWVRFGEIVGP